MTYEKLGRHADAEAMLTTVKSWYGEVAHTGTPRSTRSGGVSPGLSRGSRQRCACATQVWGCAEGRPASGSLRSEPRFQAIERAQVSVLTRARPACRTSRPTRW